MFESVAFPLFIIIGNLFNVYYNVMKTTALISPHLSAL